MLDLVKLKLQSVLHSKAVMDSKQVAVLVPTTILAEQHYNTFKDRLAKYPIEIAMLSRFVKKYDQEKILEKLRTVKLILS